MGAPVLRLDDEDWMVLEDAIGGNIPDDERTKITRLVNTYFDRCAFEWNAPFLNDAVDIVNEIKKGATGFKSVLDKHINQPGIDCEPSKNDEKRQFEIYRASAYVDERLADEMTRMGHDFDALRLMSRGLNHLILACGVLQIGDQLTPSLEAKAQQATPEGAAWCHMTTDLRNVLKNLGFSTRIDKDSGEEDPSRFVVFIRRLQERFPSKFQRYMQTNQGLAKELAVARRKISRSKRGH